MGELSHIPFRKVDFLPISLDVDKRADGSIILRNLNPMGEASRNALEPLARWAEARPDQVWLAERPEGEAQLGVWRTLTYREAWQQVQAIASHLIGYGLGADAPLMILSGNSIEHALISYAAMLVGAPVSPVSTAYSLMSSDFAKLRHVHDLVKPKMIFVQDDAIYKKALDQLDLRGAHLAAVKASGNRTINYQDFLKPLDLAAVAARYQKLDWDCVARLLFTSGSTGIPKAVINTHGMLAVNMVMGRKVLIEDENQPRIVVSWLPWNHVFGSNAVLHAVLVVGGTLYIDRGRPVPGQFDDSILTLKEIAPTMYSNVPMAYHMLAEALESDQEMARLFFSRLRYLAYGGAALGQDLADRMQRIAVETTGERILFTTGYGATETGPTITTVHWETERMGLLGLPLPGVEVKLAPVGEKMEVRARGVCITPGYFRDDEKTRAAFDEEGFYCLGDAAKFVDADDFTKGLVFDGRIKEDFKLATGTWVNAGRLRVEFIDAMQGALQDCVIAGLDKDYIGVLGFPNMAELRKIAGADAPDEELIHHPKVRAELAARLRNYNQQHRGSSSQARRLLLLALPPDADRGEITDKGYINQRAVLDARADCVEALYADPPAREILTA